MATNLKWNIILVGESGVGKKSLCSRFAKNRFREKYSPTIIVERFTKKTKINGSDLDLQIWSTASQECFRSFLPQYFQVAHGCILVYDATSDTNVDKLYEWLSEFKSNNENAPVIIVGNKSEDQSCRTKNRSKVKSFADKEKFICMECSAKTGENVDKVFEFLIQMIWKNIHPEPVLKCTEEEKSPVHQNSEDSRDKKKVHEKYVKTNNTRQFDKLVKKTFIEVESLGFIKCKNLPTPQGRSRTFCNTLQRQNFTIFIKKTIKCFIYCYALLVLCLLLLICASFIL